METIEPAYSAGPLLGIAAGAVALLLLLIIRFKLHAFVALVLVSALTAVATRIPPADLVATLTSGFGSTLASVALLVGFGVMIGRLLEVTGGAQVLADTLVGRFGAKRAPFALGIASLLFGFPIFFDAGFVVFLPIILSVARRFGGSTLTYALPSAGAFAIMHAFVPPHPGPVAAADLLGANVGLLVLVGVVVALPTWYVATYLFGQYAGRRHDIPLPASWGGSAMEDRTDGPAAPAPRFGLVLTLLLLPLLLIFLNTGISAIATATDLDGEQTWVGWLQVIGSTPVALLITVLVAMVVLGRGRYSAGEVEKLVNDSLGPICAVVLITGAGGMFGGVLRASGIGDALADSLDAIGLPVIVAAFLVSTLLRVAQGSATVALTTTAGLIAPTVAAADLSDLGVCFVVIAIACGATVLSHVNDSGFWLVGRFLGMDVPMTLRTWTVMETLIGVVGFAIVLVLSLVL